MVVEALVDEGFTVAEVVTFPVAATGAVIADGLAAAAIIRTSRPVGRWLMN